ncbi:50S ribosomal protein L35 [Candidatus Mesenet endosymbiont of Agriotes lineatus]|uniref:50S ribosomal protein L35 n=1 Tax=Candidatus Mesenet endosymbiont of Agriotes lineatus TaxID=3077948 RepID=UPI003977A297
MPKLKTKSSVKKRFCLTASGKIRATQSGKRHGMTKRSKGAIRNQRGTTILNKSDSRIVKLYIPYGL